MTTTLLLISAIGLLSIAILLIVSKRVRDMIDEIPENGWKP